MAKILPVLILVCSIHVSAWGLTSPWFRISAEAGMTTNLFGDKFDQEDKFGGISLSLEQNLHKSVILFYDGNIQEYIETNDLGYRNHEGGLFFHTYLGPSTGIQLTTSISDLQYYSYFSSYNNRILNGALSLNSRLDNTLNIRAGIDAYSIRYPSYSDTLSVNFNEMNSLIGVNFSIPVPIAVDMEAGLQYRNYVDFESPTETRYGWMSCRLSGPLGYRFGGSLAVILHEQFYISDDELYSLSTGGIDPSELLWDGWSLRGNLTRIIGNWKTTGRIEAGRASFLENIVLTSSSARIDHRLSMGISFQRKILSDNKKWLVGVIADYLYYYNDSSNSFYSYDSHSVFFRFTFEPY